MHIFFDWINKKLTHDKSIRYSEKLSDRKLIWTDDFHFEINNIKFKLSTDTNVLQGLPLDNSFLLGK